MAISNYSELQTAVALWLNRGDLTDKIPDFISLAEARLNRDLKLRVNYAEASLSTAIGSNTVALPSGFVEAETLWNAASADREEIQQVVPPTVQISATPGKPLGYWIDGAIYFERPCDAVYPLVMRYIAKFALSDDSPTNWLLTNHPDSYLFAALEEAGPYLRDTEAQAIYTARAQRAIADVQSQSARNRQAELRTDIPPNRAFWPYRS